jgi:hypothetical protein
MKSDKNLTLAGCARGIFVAATAFRPVSGFYIFI